MTLTSNSIKKRDHHVTFCAGADYALKGSQAERETVQYLLDHLQLETVGDYHMLVNYNITESSRGEVDVVVINRLGVFLLEIKNWKGLIEAHDNIWLFRGAQERPNALNSIDNKARVLHAQLFKKGGRFQGLNRVSVIGLVVLTQGLKYFVNRGKNDSQRIVDLSSLLIEALSTKRLLFSGTGSHLLSDSEIQKISQFLYEKYEPSEVIVHNYRIVRELSFGDLCDVFESMHTQFDNCRVRLKRYQLHSLTEDKMVNDIRQFQRSAKAVWALGSHPNILTTLDFFGDDIRQQQDVFYEITELPTGPSLEDVMQMKVQQGRKMPLAEQLSFLEPICRALQHAHNHKDERGRAAPVYHRNICPETVFQMLDGNVKIGDFDFAKFGNDTITVPNQTLIEKPYTAPELLQDSSLATASSDIYALGVLWYFLACLPATPHKFDPTRIDTLDLPEEARALLKRMTAKWISDRPESVEEVESEIVQIKKEAK